MYELQTRDIVWLMASLYGVRSRGKPRENLHLSFFHLGLRCFSPADELSITDKRLGHEGDKSFGTLINERCRNFD